MGYTPCRRRGHATLYRASYVASRTLTDPLGSTRTMNRSAVVVTDPAWANADYDNGMAV